MRRTHGGDWFSWQREYGVLPLDFSASISPLGLPPAAARAAAEALRTADRYPDPACRELRNALSRTLGVPADRIVCGNGCADLIYRLAHLLRPQTALVLQPGFSEYALALREVGCTVTHHMLSEENGFLPCRDLLTTLETLHPDVLFLCQPNNPTGCLTEPGLLREILRRCEECGTLLVVDECFLDFVDFPEQYTLLGRLCEHSGLILLRAFTKTCAMAGLRLGYALCGDAALAERLRSTGQPWPVSSPAMAAGIAALEDTDYRRRLHALISRERRRMLQELRALGLTVIPGEANFLLFRSGLPSLCALLQPYGILLRDCADFPGLEPGWVRCAIRTEEENTRLLDALHEILSPSGK